MESNLQGEDKMKVSNYSDLYKYNGLTGNQGLRRNQQLENLKKRRNEVIDDFRNITGWASDEVSMQVETDDIPCRKRNRENLKVEVMLSEWMIDVPEDLEENWYFKVAPAGKRNLVIAAKGLTKAYNKKNELKACFKSALPSGGLGPISKSGITILDCVYANKTFYVLDILAWNAMCVLNCSAEFRFFFLESKFTDCPEFLSESREGFKFRSIEHAHATRSQIECIFSEAIHIHNEPVKVNGVLFYHKDSIYTPGITPLIGWLKPYMLPEQLDVMVNSFYLSRKPKNYTTFANHMAFIIKKKGKCGGASNLQNDDMMNDWADVVTDDMDCEESGSG